MRMLARFSVIGSLVLLVGCGFWGGGGRSAASPSLPPLESCIEATDHAREVVFASANGEQVVGATLGGGDVGVVLAHKVYSNLCEWLPFARTLRDRGRRVLLFDFASDPAGDVAGAAGELRRLGAQKIVLVGASKGGTASLVAAHGIVPTVAGVASLSGPANYAGMDALTTVKSLTVPVPFMAGASDQSGGFDFPADARTMYAACPSQHKQLTILPGADHGEQLLEGDSADQAREVLLKFIDAASPFQ